MNHKIFLLLLFSVIVFPYVSASECSNSCITTGYTSGVCRATTCNLYETRTSNVVNCTLRGTAVVTIGKGAIETYQDSLSFIDQDEKNPDWVWILRSLTSNQPTQITDTTDSSKHLGVILGVRNKFTARSTSSTTNKDAISKGNQICFPNSYVCLRFDSLNTEDYAAYYIKKEITDLSSINSTWASKTTILIQSADTSDGLTLQVGSNVTTDKIWLAYNTSNNIVVVYEDSNNLKKLASTLSMSGGTVNIADFNYKKTSGTDIQLNLVGNADTADNLNLILDILGDEGLTLTNGYDDVTIQLSHSASGDFDGIGDTAGSSESAEISWRNNNLGKKTITLLTAYGIKILNPDSNGNIDQVALKIPSDQVKANIKFTGIKKETDIITKTTTTYKNPEQAQAPEFSSTIKEPRKNNLILIGGPCVNPLVTALFGITCIDWLLSPDESLIKITKNGENAALLVAGTTARDTVLAGNILINKKINGSSVRITGPNQDSAKITTLENDLELNLTNFPYPFIKNSKYNNIKVVLGDNAQIEDAQTATKVLSKLLQHTSKTIIEKSNQTASETETAELSDEIALGNNLADSGFFSGLLTNTQIRALQDKSINYNGQEQDIEENIMLYNSGPTIQTSLTALDDSYGDQPYLEITEGELRYYYTFKEPIDLKQLSSSNPLGISVLGKDMSITTVTTTTLISESVDRHFMDVGDTILVDNKKVTLTNFNDESLVFNINNKPIIILHDHRTSFEGLNIRTNALFRAQESNCCCFNVLNYFS